MLYFPTESLLANPGGRGEGVDKKEGWSGKGRKEEKEGEEREAKEENERE